jgi:hypothetical protein
MNEPRVLRPMEYGEIFNEAFDLYKRNFPLFVGIGAAVYVPYAILSALVVHSQVMQQIVTLGFLLPLMGTYAAIVKSLADRYLGEPVTIGGAWRYVLRRLLPYSLTWLIVGLLFGILMVGFITAGVFASRAQGAGSAVIVSLVAIVLMIIAAFWLAFLPSVMIVEDRFYLAALRRSRELSAGNWWRIVVVSFCTFIAVYGVTIVVMAIFGVFLGLEAVMTGAPGMANPSPTMRGWLIGFQLTYGLLQALLTPLLALPLVLLYFDVRVRREGYDIELLAREMGSLPQNPRSPGLPA